MIGPVFVRKVIDPFTVRAGDRRIEQVAELVLAGLSDKEIANELGVSMETVKRYLRELYNLRNISPFGDKRARFIEREMARLKCAGNPSESECATTRECGE